MCETKKIMKNMDIKVDKSPNKHHKEDRILYATVKRGKVKLPVGSQQFKFLM